MRNFIFVFLAASLLAACGASKNVPTAANSPVKTKIDLVQTEGDKVKVTIDPGVFSADSLSFFIPKTVPGTYSTDNYGKFIEGLQAWDYEGGELPVIKADENSWKIAQGRQLDKITYLVNDTYDTEFEEGNTVFSPAGTNIEQGETYMLNLHGFVGYFGGFQEVPYELTILVPPGLDATTSLKESKAEATTPGSETYLASRYFEVIDNPIHYTRENKASLQIGDITVNLSVYSPTSIYSASDLQESMEKMMQAQKAFLGDMNTTREYNILLHLSTMEKTDANGFGALEHHSSTVVVMPEQMPKETLEQALIDVVSHEFFHIVTPLNVHSEEIQYFDFNEPVMSRHLWMYEGTTEYFAHLFQIQQGLISEEEFYDRMMDKITNARAYDDTMSFTTMSTNILQAPYKENYANVYEKGALINMALDILLKELSNGEKGVLWLMKELSAKYDEDTPFKDEVLIDEIVAMTYPEVQSFFEMHVVGDEPIDYEKYLSKAGISIQVAKEPSGFFLKDEVPYIDVDQENEDAIFIREGIALHSFFTEIGAMGGDVIQSINGTPIDLEAIRPVIAESFSWSPEKEIRMVVKRGGEEVVLEGAAGSPIIEVEHIVPMEEPSAAQLALRTAWLKG